MGEGRPLYARKKFLGGGRRALEGQKDSRISFVVSRQWGVAYLAFDGKRRSLCWTVEGSPGNQIEQKARINGRESVRRGGSIVGGWWVAEPSFRASEVSPRDWKGGPGRG